MAAQTVIGGGTATTRISRRGTRLCRTCTRERDRQSHRQSRNRRAQRSAA